MRRVLDQAKHYIERIEQIRADALAAENAVLAEAETALGNIRTLNRVLDLRSGANSDLQQAEILLSNNYGVLDYVKEKGM
jgi:hypothetical protein